MKKHVQISSRPAARPENQVTGEHYRITVLTDRLIRFEYSESGLFVDSATQTVLNRDFPAVDFHVAEERDSLELYTEFIHVLYDKKPFSREGLYIRLRKGVTTHHSDWRYGQPFTTLGGTSRTLDGADGRIPLERGLMSRQGFSVIDDSAALRLDENGWTAERPSDGQDFYFFGYGHDYKACLKDFYYLTGPVPLIPRYALGNWWSRYYRYTAGEYLALMDRFREEGIPFSVAVMDMDWHLVDIPYDEGSGWTGYTFDRTLYPDPEGFLRALHERGLRVTLNLHPADGVRPFEDAYEAMCKRMGMDPSGKRTVNFDIADPKFSQAYFEILHHPLEKAGVDFWWLDWQQDDYTKRKGLSPLWTLNHLHFLDLARDGKRPLVFSRYAGVGSHRYPIGFSGDTVASWDSLAFQPEFTACASNIGFTWWSHDIGGHMRGRRDDELSLRWLQYGVFSPILRLHSTSNLFNGKEPWNYGEPFCGIMKEFLRLRHRLLPYLYTMNYRCAAEGIPPVEPIYYAHKEEEAYFYRNEYYFGPSLLVHPVTSPLDAEVGAARTDSYLPDGIFYDVFTGIRYKGGRKISFFHDVYSIPVLAKAGSILPMDGGSCTENSTGNPRHLLLKIFAGADGRFELYEDDGISADSLTGSNALTTIRHLWSEGVVELTVSDNDGLIPADRIYTFEMIGIDAAKCGEPVCLADGKPVCVHTERTEDGRTLRIRIPEPAGARRIRIAFDRPCTALANDPVRLAYERIRAAFISYELKETLFNLVENHSPERASVLMLQEGISENLALSLTEVLCADI